MSDTIQIHKKAKFRCPDCKNKYTSLAFLLNHVSQEHADNIPENTTVKQYCFNRRNNKTFQLCVICKKNKTAWNEDTGHYNRFCSEACKLKAGEIADRNLKKKTGKNRKERLSDINLQRQMLKGRSISGEYTFKDGTKLSYVGSYEHDFLRFYEEDFNGDPIDILECPFTFDYKYEGSTHVYIPDYYIPSLNLIIEIKDGGDNPNMHHKIQEVDKVKEKLKDKAVIDSKKFNFVKIYNKEYTNFLNIINIIRERNASYEEFSPIISI